MHRLTATRLLRLTTIVQQQPALLRLQPAVRWESQQQAQRAQDDQQTEQPLSSTAQHAPNALDDDLHAASSADDVFAIVQQQGGRFTDCNAVTALQRLAAVVHSSDSVAEHPSFPALVDMIMGAASTFTPQEHTKLIAAAGALHVQDQDLLDSLSRELMVHVETMDAHMLEELAVGLAKAGHSPSVALFDAIRVRAQELGIDGGATGDALRKAFAAFDYSFD